MRHLGQETRNDARELATQEAAERSGLVREGLKEEARAREAADVPEEGGAVLSGDAPESGRGGGVERPRLTEDEAERPPLSVDPGALLPGAAIGRRASGRETLLDEQREVASSTFVDTSSSYRVACA